MISPQFDYDRLRNMAWVNEIWLLVIYLRIDLLKWINYCLRDAKKSII